MNETRREKATRTLATACVAAAALAGISGLALTIPYEPSPERAHASVAALGRAWAFVRGAHVWAAAAALTTGVLALASWWLSTRPGRARGLVGLGFVALLLSGLALGPILALDQRGWEGFLHLRQALAFVAVDVGDVDEPTATPLRALFLVHLLAPALALAAGGAMVVRRPRGLHSDAGTARQVRTVAAVAAVAVGGAVFLPPGLGPAPVAGLTTSAPEWAFLWLVPLQDAAGPAGLAALPVALAGAAALAWRADHMGVAVRRCVLVAAAATLAALTFVGGWL